MDAFWNFFIQFGRWFGLAVAVVSIFLGFFALGVFIGNVALAFFAMFEVWIIGIWMGLMLMLISQVAENTRKP